MGCFVKHDDYWKEKTTSYAYIKYFRASERSPFEGSCCGKGYTAVDSLPPSPTESSEIPPPPRYFYSFLPIFRAVLFIQIWYWSTHAHRFATFHWLIWWTIWWASIIGKHSFIIFFFLFPISICWCLQISCGFVWWCGYWKNGFSLTIHDIGIHAHLRCKSG